MLRVASDRVDHKEHCEWRMWPESDGTDYDGDSDSDSSSSSSSSSSDDEGSATHRTGGIKLNAPPPVGTWKGMPGVITIPQQSFFSWYDDQYASMVNRDSDRAATFRWNAFRDQGVDRWISAPDLTNDQVKFFKTVDKKLKRKRRVRRVAAGAAVVGTTGCSIS